MIVLVIIVVVVIMTITIITIIGSNHQGEKSLINKYTRNPTDIKLYVSHKNCLSVTTKESKDGDTHDPLNLCNAFVSNDIVAYTG